MCLFLCFAPFVYLYECMCVSEFSSLLRLICLRDLVGLPCLSLLSQFFSFSRPPIHQFTLRSPSYLQAFPPFLFRHLSPSCSSPFLCPLISHGLRGLFLPISLPIIPLYFPSLALISALHTFSLHSNISLPPWAFLSFSLLHICPSIACLHNSSLSSNLFMFSLVPL